MDIHAINLKLNAIELYDELSHTQGHPFSDDTLRLIAEDVAKFYSNCIQLNLSKLGISHLAENTNNLIPTYVGREYSSTLGKFENRRHMLTSKVLDFIKHKTNAPLNGYKPGSDDKSGFGSSDSPFRSGGNFNKKELAGISHAHVTQDLSIVYRVHDGQLDIYGIYSHTDIGTGNNPNVRKQQQAAERWAKERFDTRLDISSLELDEPVAKDPASKNKKQPNPQYAPKPKAQQATPRMELAKDLSDLWPQRQLYAKLTAPGADQKRVMENEARALLTLFRGQKMSRIPAYQQEYFDRFGELLAKFA